MRTSNNSNLIGRLVKDLELKTVGDTPMVRFTLAVNRPYQKDKDNIADFIQCEAWGAQASFLEKFFKKGDPVMLGGEIRTKSWEKDGQKFFDTFFRVDNVEFALTKGSGASKEAENPIKSISASEPSLSINSDDLPF